MNRSVCANAMMSLWRMKKSVVFSTIVSGLVLLLLGVVLMARENYSTYLTSVRSQLELEIFLADDTTPVELYQLSAMLERREGYQSHQYRDKKQAYARMQHLITAGMLPEEVENAFPNSIVLKLKPQFSNLGNFRKIDTELSQLRFVNKIIYAKNWLQEQEPVLGFLAFSATALFFLVIIAASLVIYWNVRRLLLTSESKSRVLLLLGAGWRQVGLPHFAQGIVTGLLAGIVGLLLLYLILHLTDNLAVRLENLTLTSSLLILAVGVASGFVASSVTVWRMLR